MKAERVVAVVVAAYYGEGGRGKGEALRPVVEVIERAAPGVAELARTDGGPGFSVRLAERSFPAAFEAELKRAAEVALAGDWAPGEPAVGIFARIVGALRRLFSASE